MNHGGGLLPCEGGCVGGGVRIVFAAVAYANDLGSCWRYCCDGYLYLNVNPLERFFPPTKTDDTFGAIPYSFLMYSCASN